MTGVAKLNSVSAATKHAFETVWIEHKALAREIGDRLITARGLRVLMPRNYSGPALKLFRGCGSGEAIKGEFGFSWSTEIASARLFASPVVIPQGGFDSILAPDAFDRVVLTTTVPAEAILLRRDRDGFYDEDEVVVDPYLLGVVIETERHPPKVRQ